MNKTTNKFSPEVGARAVRMVLDHESEHTSRDQEHLAVFYKLAAFAGTRITTLAEGDISELHIGLKGTMGTLDLKDLAQKTRKRRTLV